MRDGGVTANEFIASMRADVNGVGGGVSRCSSNCSIDRLADVTKRLLERASGDPALAGAASVDYLDLFALTTYAWLWARMATIAPADNLAQRSVIRRRSFSRGCCRAALALTAAIDSQSAAIMDMPAESF